MGKNLLENFKKQVICNAQWRNPLVRAIKYEELVVRAMH
jgi:hypothetical protein